jgi:protein TonB
MEAKKNPNIDFYKMSGLFFNIGLVISLSLVYGIFQIESKGDYNSLEEISASTTREEIMEIPPTKQPPPPPPQLNLATIIESSNEALIEDIPTIDLEMQESASIEVVAYNETPDFDGLEDEKADKIFMIVEQQAEPVGGVEAFYDYVASQLKDNYPYRAANMNIEGVVFIQFVVEKDGSLTDVIAVKGIGAGCDELAITVIENAPKWKPGKQRGVAVRTRRIVPIRFKLIIN